MLKCKSEKLLSSYETECQIMDMPLISYEDIQFTPVQSAQGHQQGSMLLRSLACQVRTSLLEPFRSVGQALMQHCL